MFYCKNIFINLFIYVLLLFTCFYICLLFIYISYYSAFWLLIFCLCFICHLWVYLIICDWNYLWLEQERKKKHGLIISHYTYFFKTGQSLQPVLSQKHACLHKTSYAPSTLHYCYKLMFCLLLRIFFKVAVSHKRKKVRGVTVHV